MAGCSSTQDDTAGTTGIARCAVEDAGPPKPPPDDHLSATRILRRISLALRGEVPSIEDYEAIAKADPQAAEGILQSAIDDGLASPSFYAQMVDFGHEWINSGSFETGAQGDGYSGNMSSHMHQCDAASKHPGAWYVTQEAPYSGNFCNDKTADAAGTPAPAPIKQVEPWWAPGTTVTVVGWATSEAPTLDLGNGKTANCASARTLYYDAGSAPGCGCGPNLVWCYPGGGLGTGSSLDTKNQKRHVWDEPARLVAHLAWHDRALSDLVTGNYSVGNNMVRAEYVRLARRTGAYPELDGNSAWWHVGGEPRDPEHTDASDPWAWREFVMEDLAPFLMSATGGGKTPSGDLSRTFTWDPRTTTAPSPGFAAAGVLTMPGTLSSFARERPRAARFLEIFACQQFTPPPSDLGLGDPGVDIANSGTCQHCHRLMDPVALAFKRWDFGDWMSSNYAPFAFLPDVGPWKITAEHLSGVYPYGGNPYQRWSAAWIPGTVLTPITADDVKKNPGAIFYDTIPKDYEILGAHPDGTSGPLGFGKVLVASGAFDRCAVQKLYKRFVGRPLDPATENLYITRLANEFAQEGRKVRPFLRNLFSKPEFRRGL